MGAKDAYNLLLEGDCGGNIGSKDAVGGCNQLFNGPGPTPTPPNPAPVNEPTFPNPAPVNEPTFPNPAPVIPVEPTFPNPAPFFQSETFAPTGTYSPTIPEESDDY